MPPSKLKTFDPSPSLRPCDHPGCRETGEFRAPRSPRDLDAHYWFCLEHIRAYNASWDFFAGMSQPEIEAFQKNSVTWLRPTWRFGIDPDLARRRTYTDRRSFAERARDDLGILREAFGTGTSGEPAARKEPAYTPQQRRALATLNLDSTADLQQIKVRYKELVKKFHPDANGGCRKAEEQLKAINQAYASLVSRRGTRAGVSD
jgi:hypothetical protein